MKIAMFTLAGIVGLALSVPSQAQHYDLDDGGSATLPTGSKISCITMTTNGKNTATCTMKLAGDDTKDVFPVSVSRHGKRYDVLPEDASPNRAWSDCGDDCIRGK